MTSHLKLSEAQFFIELLQSLEERSESLTHLEDPNLEASFLWAAILNAFYSTVEIMRVEGFDTRDFKKLHPEIYADGSKGGERAKTVHISHSETSLAGYIPPRGDSVNLRFIRRSKLSDQRPKTPERVDLVFRPHYYFAVTHLQQQVHAVSFCLEHLAELKKYHQSSNAA